MRTALLVACLTVASFSCALAAPAAPATPLAPKAPAGRAGWARPSAENVIAINGVALDGQAFELAYVGVRRILAGVKDGAAPKLRGTMSIGAAFYFLDDVKLDVAGKDSDGREQVSGLTATIVEPPRPGARPEPSTAPSTAPANGASSAASPSRRAERVVLGTLTLKMQKKTMGKFQRESAQGTATLGKLTWNLYGTSWTGQRRGRGR